MTHPDFRTATPEVNQISNHLPQEPYYQNQGRSKQRALGVLLILAGLIWLISILLANLFTIGGSSGGTTIYDQTVPARRLVIDAGSADVALSRWNGPGVRVVAIRHGGADSDYNTSLRQDGDTVYVSGTVQPCLLCWRELSYQIELPANLPVALTSTSGDVVVQEASGTFDLRTTSGDIQLTDVSGPLSIVTISGDVELTDGLVRGANITTTSGDVNLSGLSDALVVASISGDIEINDAQNASLTLSTTSGDIEYRGSLAGTSENTINTISGDVQLTLPAESNLKLDASSISGEIESNLPINSQEASERSIQGTTGDGSTSLQIHTTSGSVQIEAE